MLKRPSLRLKSHGDPVAINLVPMLDALVTLIAFLLFSMSFVAIVGLESPAPIVSPDPASIDSNNPPLQLTLTIGEREAELWSPFKKIESQLIPNLPNGKPDSARIHQLLVAIKQAFPIEKQIVFIPSAAVSYETLIHLMDTARLIEPSDPAIYFKDAKSGVDRSAVTLFPEVIFGNLLTPGGP